MLSPSRADETLPNRPYQTACFNAKTGDVEDAPALDALTAFKVVEKDGAVYVQGEEAAIKSGRRKPNVRCRVSNSSDTDKVIVGELPPGPFPSCPRLSWWPSLAVRATSSLGSTQDSLKPAFIHYEKGYR